MKVAIIIPAFNEETTIGSVVRDVAKFGTPVMVDDGSTDATREAAEAAGAIALVHDTNAGYDAALITGLSYARKLGFDVAVTCDADGQHNARSIGEVLNIMRNEDVDLVIGLRTHSARVSEFLFNLYVRARFGVRDILCGLKGYRLARLSEESIAGLLDSIGTSIALEGLRNKVRYALVEVPLNKRRGKSTFGHAFSANQHILRAMVTQIFHSTPPPADPRLG